MGIAAMVLSAGASSRMGQPKQLMLINDKPMIQHVFRTISRVPFTNTYCVLGAHKEKIAPLVPKGVTQIINKNWSSGLSESIKAGLNTVLDNHQLDAVFLFLADQPFILTSDIVNMFELYSSNSDHCIATSHCNNPGVPAIFPRRLFGALMKLQGEKGAQSLLKQSASKTILYEHHGEIIDIDTPEAYDRVQDKLKNLN